MLIQISIALILIILSQWLSKRGIYMTWNELKMERFNNHVPIDYICRELKVSPQKLNNYENELILTSQCFRDDYEDLLKNYNSDVKK